MVFFRIETRQILFPFSCFVKSCARNSCYSLSSLSRDSRGSTLLASRRGNNNRSLVCKKFLYVRSYFCSNNKSRGQGTSSFPREPQEGRAARPSLRMEKKIFRVETRRRLLIRRPTSRGSAYLIFDKSRARRVTTISSEIYERRATISTRLDARRRLLLKSSSTV